MCLKLLLHLLIIFKHRGHISDASVYIWEAQFLLTLLLFENFYFITRTT